MNLLQKLVGKLQRDGIWATIAAILRYPFVKSRRMAYHQMLQETSLEERFHTIYEKNLWGSPESASGEGSEAGYTAPLRAWMIAAIPRYNIKKLVDAPCGDFNWMKLVLPHVNIEYFGLDIVETVINQNKKLYGNEKIHFDVANICKDKLPPCDLLMVRDCLFHLSYQDIDRFLANIAELDYQYLLTTTHLVDETHVNHDIIAGHFRKINLFNAPFDFKKASVIEAVDDYPQGHPIPRQMILIAKADVPKTINFTA